MSPAPCQSLTEPSALAFDGVLLDLDGTLWDTTEACAAAWSRALANVGQEGSVTAADIAQIMGLTHEQIFPRLFPDMPPALREQLSEECYRQETEHIERLGGRLYSGVAEGLPRLASVLPLFIVSNCQRGYIELFLRVTGMGGCFRDHECHGGTGLSKAENIALIVGRNSVKRAVYVGDTATDASAAQAAGVPFVFVEYGFGECDQAHKRFASFTELVEWIFEKNKVVAP